MTKLFLLLTLSAFSLGAFAQANALGVQAGNEENADERCNVAVVGGGGDSDAPAPAQPGQDAAAQGNL